MLFSHRTLIPEKKKKKENFNVFPQNLSETEKQQLKQHEEYLKKKQDLLLATKKESKNNVPPPPNTDQKEEESPPKEVKDFHINPWVVSVQVSVLLLICGNGLKRTRGGKYFQVTAFAESFFLRWKFQ